MQLITHLRRNRCKTALSQAQTLNRRKAAGPAGRGCPWCLPEAASFQRCGTGAAARPTINLPQFLPTVSPSSILVCTPREVLPGRCVEARPRAPGPSASQGAGGRGAEGEGGEEEGKRKTKPQPQLRPGEPLRVQVPNNSPPCGGLGPPPPRRAGAARALRGRGRSVRGAGAASTALPARRGEGGGAGERGGSGARRRRPSRAQPSRLQTSGGTGSFFAGVAFLFSRAGRWWWRVRPRPRVCGEGPAAAPGVLRALALPAVQLRCAPDAVWLQRGGADIAHHGQLRLRSPSGVGPGLSVVSGASASPRAQGAAAGGAEWQDLGGCYNRGCAISEGGAITGGYAMIRGVQ